MNINNILNYETFEDDFLAFSNPQSTRPVVVTWGGTGLHTIAGPTPFVDISKSFNTNEAGVLESIVNTITLTGKIVKPSGIGGGVGGLTNTVSSIKSFEKLFRDCTRNNLEIWCDNNNIFSATGVSVKNISFNKTEDNWVQTVDYTIDLEYKTGPSDKPEDQVEDRQETWTIEPLDDAVYNLFIQNVLQKPETFNPNLKPRAPSIGNPVPPGSVNGGQFGVNPVQIFNVPQFRISRRLSAKGLSPPPGSSTTVCLPSEAIEARRKTLFLSAKAWVDKQSSIPFNGSTASGSIYISDTPGVLPPGPTWLYNHSRTISADVYNGTYEANDSWIAMPTGIPYIETFTIDASTDLNNTKTVRIAGNIQGLHITPMSMMSGGWSPMVTGTSNANIRIDVSKMSEQSPKFNINHSVPSLPADVAGGSARSHITEIQSNKYHNALEAWTKDIKPYLYRRACLGVNSQDRAIAPTENDPSKPLPNPIHSPEQALNINPVSTSEGHDPIKGIITYNHEFNNSMQMITGVISENIRISHTAPAASIQETPILGRALGPLLSNAGVTNPRKTITIDIVVPRRYDLKATLLSDPKCPMYYNGYYWQTINQIIAGNEPFSNRKTYELFKTATMQNFGTVFKDSDSEDWSPTEGRYSRTVSWTYQQCTADRFYLDH